MDSSVHLASGSYVVRIPAATNLSRKNITFWGFDTDLLYFAYGCISMRGCVAYIHDPNSTLNFDLKVKFIYNYVFVVSLYPSHNLLFALTLAYYIWHMGLTP